MLGRFVIPLCVAIGAALFSSAGHCDITFFDGTFADLDWQMSIQTHGNGGYAYGATLPTGGSPGAYRSTTIQVNAYSHVQAAYIRADWSYTPSIQGAITSVDYSLDRMSNSVGVNLALKQGDKHYYCPGLAYYGGAWSHQAFTAMAQDDWADIYSGTHPDFSMTGSTITWGFSVANSSTLDWGYTASNGIDNVSIRLHTVPEPSTLVTLLTSTTGLAGSMMRRRWA